MPAFSIETLREYHGGVWGECPEYPKSDWQAEVANNDTVLGYWEWVYAQLEQENDR